MPVVEASSPLAWLGEVERQREAAGLRRRLRTRSAAEPEIDLASNDYLGLSRHPQVIEAGVEALRIWGAGSTGSRLVTGNTELHEELEQELATFMGTESALVFSSGYTANLGAVVALSGPGTLIVSDARTHASLIDACRLSRARVVVTPYRDTQAVAATWRSAPKNVRWCSPTRSSAPTVRWPRWPNCMACAAATAQCCWSTRRTGLVCVGRVAAVWSPK